MSILVTGVFGSSTNERAKSLNRIVKLVDDIDYKSDDGKDILGAIYQYLMGQFAAWAGKKGGEGDTPHEVSEILSRIVTLAEDKSDEFFTEYDWASRIGFLASDCRTKSSRRSACQILWSRKEHYHVQLGSHEPDDAWRLIQ